MNVLPADAATVMLLRPCQDRNVKDVEVLMVKRNRKSSFVPGYYVFPGGVVDPEDFVTQIEAFVRGIDRSTASLILPDMSQPGKALGAWVAGIRETFEEVGILLAETKSGDAVTIQTPQERLRFDHYRRMIIEHKITFSQMLENEGLVLPLHRLFYFSHWITPEGFPLRYDVRFFVTEVPLHQTVSHDGVELTSHIWIRPKEALRQYRQGRLDMVLPQIMTLEEICLFKTAAQAIESARKRHVPATLTKILRVEGKDVEVMPDGTIYNSRPPTYSWPDDDDR